MPAESIGGFFGGLACEGRWDMFGVNQNAVKAEGQKQIDQNPILQKMAAALPGFLEEFNLKELRKKLPRSKQITLAKWETKHFTYCLMRYPNLTGKKLSHQQTKIALLAADGLTNKDIAEKLGIKAGSVASHIVQIYLKLNIKSRARLAVKSILLK